MLPRALVEACCRGERGGERTVPRYLAARDEPWLCALLEERARFVGLRLNAFRERLREPLSPPAPRQPLRLAGTVLDALSREPGRASLPPKEARAVVFRVAASGRVARHAVLEECARALSVTPEELERALFADLAAERVVAALPESLTATGLALEANRVLLSSLLRLAMRVQLRVWGDARALVKQTRRAGLLCVIRALSDARGEGLELDISGPFALFRQSQLYGRALAGLLPRLMGQTRFELDALCPFQRDAPPILVSASSDDPLPIERTQHPSEGQLEKRFVSAFRRAAPAWDIDRDPPARAVGASLAFADFELRDRRSPERIFQLELVGFWTPEYLRAKLEQLRAAGLTDWLLCVDERRACQDGELPDDPRLIRYRSRLPARAVLDAIRALPGPRH